MNIFLDARYSKRKDGTGRVTKNMTHNLLSFDSSNIYYVLLYQEDSIDFVQSEKIKKIVSHYAAKNGPIRVAWDLIVLPMLLLRYHIQLYYSFEGFCAPILFKGKIFITIHDLIPLRVKGYYQKLFNRLWFFFRVKIAVRKADKVFVVSSFTKKEVEEEFPNLKGKIEILPNALDEGFMTTRPSSDAILRKNNLTVKKYILCIGGLEKRKNNGLTIQAFLELIKQLPDIDIDLAVIGIGNEAYRRVSQVESFTIPEKLISRIHFIPTVSEEELHALYKQAYIFVFASLYEGFGMPLLEAMYYEIPVIALNATSLPEVGGDACLYSQNDVPSMLSSIRSLLEDTNLYLQLQEKGKKQMESFSWEKDAQTVLQQIENATS